MRPFHPAIPFCHVNFGAGPLRHTTLPCELSSLFLGQQGSSDSTLSMESYLSQKRLLHFSENLAFTRRLSSHFGNILPNRK